MASLIEVANVQLKAVSLQVMNIENINALKASRLWRVLL